MPMERADRMSYKARSDKYGETNTDAVAEAGEKHRQTRLRRLNTDLLPQPLTTVCQRLS